MKPPTRPAKAPSDASTHARSVDAFGCSLHEADAAEWMRGVVDRFESPLTQYVTRLMRGDIDRARDVVQDAFVRLWSADRTAVESHLGQWLYRVCRNRALDVRRKESRMTTLQDDKLDVVGRLHSSNHDASHSADGGAPMREPHGPAVIAMLNTLNESQQEALRLKFQGGLSYKEIATVMDITSNHVGVLIHNAIKALREHMAAGAPSAQAVQQVRT